MKRFDKLIEEWEKTLLLTTAGVVALFFLILFWPSDKEGNISQQGTLPATPNYVQTKQMSFLEPAKLENMVNPMAFRRKIQTARRPENKNQQNTPENGQKPAQAQQTPPQKDPGVKPQAPPPKPKPARIITLTYRGIYKGLQNTELAFVRTSDSAEKNKTSSLSVQTGEKLHDLFTVVSFDENQLKLRDQNQETITLPRNRDTKVKIQ